MEKFFDSGSKTHWRFLFGALAVENCVLNMIRPPLKPHPKFAK
jgi:hypothetical protein